MNELNKIYKKQLEDELALISKNEVFNKERANQKILAFLSQLGVVGEECQAFSFWDNSTYSDQEVLDAYIDGLQLLLSIGFELKVDALKSINEIPLDITLVDEFITLYKNSVKLLDSYNFEDYQHLIDDYFMLGFKLNFSLKTILKSYKEHL